MIMTIITMMMIKKEQLKRDVLHISSTNHAFAAVKSDDTIVALL